MTRVKVFLKSGRERRIENYHPWGFRDDVLRTEGDSSPGEVADVHAESGALIGRGYYNATAPIPLRILTRSREKVDESFYRTLVRGAIARRTGLVVATDALRLVHAEADGMPGVVVDRFRDTLAVQIRNAGAERHRDLIVSALRAETGAAAAYERSETVERTKEGIEPRTGGLWGDVPDPVVIREDDLEFGFSPLSSQKTGFYLDQRDNRRRLAATVVPGDRFLDVYSYTGAFSLQAARRGATALAVDKDPVALAALETTARANGLDRLVGTRLGDALEVLDTLVREGRRFTHAVLDPPTLAKRKDEVTAAKRLFTIGTKNVLRMLEPGGRLLVSTCAYHIKVEDLIEATRFAAGDAGRRLVVEDVTYQPADHPWILQVPESLYLKSLILRAD